MKKLVAILMTIILVTLSITGFAGGRLDAIKKAGKLVVGTSPDYPPYEFPGPDGKNVGADIEFAQYIADALGVELVVEAFTFEAVLAAIAAGKIDIALAGLDPKPERRASMDFTDIYYTEANQMILIRKEDADSIKTLADFGGKKVGAQNGTLQQALVEDQLPNSEMELITLIPDGVMMLQTKKIDGLALASVVAKQYTENYPELVVCESQFDFVSEGIAAAIPLGEPELLEFLNEVIAEVNEKGIFDEWIDKAVQINNEMNK
ncbi:MAG: transporter substrate-binding domain-containing protein [Christensenellaceae bacterium]|mgnify:CR=1 FL=1|nr:transporter substrate-binding domain-containing protein [Christensenellaceae bacterium]